MGLPRLRRHSSEKTARSKVTHRGSLANRSDAELRPTHGLILAIVASRDRRCVGVLELMRLIAHASPRTGAACCIGSHDHHAGKKMDAAQAIASPRFSEELAD
jgi:hypothetical protein